jgi:3-hydroxybutyryl-CoA dehydrogenase
MEKGIMNRIKQIGIIGEGKMGTGIFYYLLDFDLDLVWICSADADTNKLNRQFIRRINRSFEAGIISRHQFDTLQNTLITNDLSALRQCDLIIEAIPESVQLKKDVFERLNIIAKPEAIFTSNSSSINPSEIAPPGERAGKFAGLHFFYPVALKNIVELTVSAETTTGTIGLIESFLHQIQRRFITLDEQNSFLLNKIYLDFQNEAFLMVVAGKCSIAQMDQLVRNHFFPFGVFDFCDSVGLDTMHLSILNYTRDYPDKMHYSRFTDTLHKLVSQDKLGKKTGTGFYTYPMVEVNVEEPLNAREIQGHLNQVWIASSKRFTSQAKLPAHEVNHAILEYFGTSGGPLE